LYEALHNIPATGGCGVHYPESEGLAVHFNIPDPLPTPGTHSPPGLRTSENERKRAHPLHCFTDQPFGVRLTLVLGGEKRISKYLSREIRTVFNRID
jgi:hypothetical protein